MNPAGPTERIGRYDVYSEIASGGMASVFLGREAAQAGGFSRTVAIKRLLPHVAGEPEFVQMFLDEARLAKRIRNGHVVETLDIVSSAGELALVMEYVHGEALSKLLTTAAHRGERVDPRVAVAIAVGIFDGLHAAHEARSEHGAPLDIVHRDVSPQNVLVGLDGVARVFDFGIAKAADRLHTTEDGSLKGKLAYMAPEQLETGVVDRRADVWAAAVVLWEMLAGRRLFVGDSQNALIHVVLTREVPPLSSFGLPSQLDAILARGLARDVNARYPTAKAMANDLLEVLSPAPTQAVSSFVQRNASVELGQRARLVEEVGRSSGPSGDTTNEVPAVDGHRSSARLGQARQASRPREAVFDDNAPTRAWKGDHPDDEPKTNRDFGDGDGEDATMLQPRDQRSSERQRPRAESVPDGEPGELGELEEDATHERTHARRSYESHDHERDEQPPDELRAVEDSHDRTRPGPIEEVHALRSSGVSSPARPHLHAGPRLTPIDPFAGVPLGAQPQPMPSAMPQPRGGGRGRSDAGIVAIAVAVSIAVLLLVIVIGVVRKNAEERAAPQNPAPVMAPTYVTMPSPVPAPPTVPTVMTSPTSTSTPATSTSAPVPAAPPKPDPRRGHPRPTPRR